MLRRRLLLLCGGGASAEVDVNHVTGLAYHNTTQTVLHNNSTAMNLNSEEWDPSGFHDPVTNSSRITVPAGLAGVYWFHAGTWLAGSVGSDVHIFFRVNGSTTGPRLSHQLVSKPAGPDIGYIQVEAILNLADGDYVEFFIYLDDSPTGASRNFGHATIADAQTAVAWVRLSGTP